METTETTTLFRPVGRKELELIRELGNKGFPPRLWHQPIFYPVLTEDYARRIASQWNMKEAVAGYAGFVTRFQVKNSYLDKHEAHEAGGRALREYWIPAEGLDEFNENIVGEIEVIAGYIGAPPHGAAPRPTGEAVGVPTPLAPEAALRKSISSGSPFEAIAGYSRALVEGKDVFVSGTTGFNYQTMQISEDLGEQTEQAMQNIAAALQQAGASMDDVVRVRYYLTAPSQFELIAPIVGKHLGKARPAATAVVVQLIDARMKIEIEVTARLP